MNFKEEYKKLVEIVKKTRKANEEAFRNQDIADILGYSRTYFSGLLGKSVPVTSDHIKNLRLNFPFLSDNHTKKGEKKYTRR